MNNAYGDYLSADADGFVSCEREKWTVHWNSLSVNFVSITRIISERIDGPLDVVDGVVERFAIVYRFNAGDGVDVALDEVCPFEDETTSF